MPDVFSLATATVAKPPPGPVQYVGIRSPVTDAEHGRLQLAKNQSSGDVMLLQIKPGGTIGDPVDALNARNLAAHALRQESHAVEQRRDALTEQRAAVPDTAKGAEVGAALEVEITSADKRIAEIIDEIKALPKIAALVCAPVAKALMLMSAEDDAASK